jgi:hypothetical protein
MLDMIAPSSISHEIGDATSNIERNALLDVRSWEIAAT